MPNSMVVPEQSPHKHNARGGCTMQEQPEMVIKSGKTTIQIIAPAPMPQEEKERRLNEFYDAAWALWDSLSTEEKLKINAECSGK